MAPQQGDIQVTIRNKSERRRSSHEIAKAVRPIVRAVGERFGARVKVAEVPPGPPVLQTLVAEIYGPDDAGRREVAARVRDLLARTPEGAEDLEVQAPRKFPG